MPISFIKGFNWLNGNTVMPSRLNAAQESLILNCATAIILGRVTGGAGAVEELTPAQVRTLLGLVIGTDVQAADADLTAIAALATTAYGRAFLTLADAAAGRTALGLGTAATQASGDFDAAGAAAAAVAASQPVDADLTAIAALTTTAYGRAFLALADAAAGRAALGVLGSNLESLVDSIIQAGVVGTDLVFTAGPTLDITAGTWLLWGSAGMRTNDSPGDLCLGFRNTTDGVDFGKSAGARSTDLAVIFAVSCFGYVTVAANKTIKLKGFINGAHTLEMGHANIGAGALRAVRLTL